MSNFRKSGPAHADFRALFEALPRLIIAVAPDSPRFTIVAVTEAFCRTVMKLRDDIVGRALFESFPDANPEVIAPTVADNLRASLEQVIVTRMPHQMAEERYDTQRPDGTWIKRFWAATNTPVCDRDGNVQYIMHIAEDVTRQNIERETAEAAARRGERLLERISDAVLTLDTSWHYVSSNPAGTAMLQHAGVNLEQLRDLPVWEAIPGLLGTSFERGVREAVETGRVTRVEVSYRQGGGDRFIAEGDAVPLAEGVAILLRDVSEFRRLLDAERDARATAENERMAAERARQDADEANQAKSAFLATMSHEIRTPINAQIGYAQLIELGIAGPVTAQQREYLTRIAATSEHLRGLVDDILDLSKIDAGGMHVAREHSMTGGLVATALDLVRLQASVKGVTLIDNRQGEAGEPFIGDEHRVRQIVTNLLSNAVKFTPSGGTVTVMCGMSSETPTTAVLHGEGPWTYISVTDNGIGIPSREHHRIFEPFHQVERGNTREHGGTGLGLAISRRLARLMGGDITLQSTPGEGSTFCLWLPAAGVDPAKADGTIETAATRGQRARRRDDRSGLHYVREVGALLRENIDEIIVASSARLRADTELPQVAQMRRTELEDHQLSFLADIAQTLGVIDEDESMKSELLRDGSTIQRVIAELHGAMRHRRGWTEEHIAREFAHLNEEIAALVRRRLPDRRGDTDRVLEVIGRLLTRAQITGAAALRRSADRKT